MKLRFYLIVASLTFGLVFNACNKGCRLLESTNEGSIVGSYSFGACDFYSTIDSNLIITTDADFKAFVDYRMSGCTSKNAIPTIEFNKHSLIGFMQRTPGCNVAFHRKLTIDHAAKTYTYSIAKEVCTGCNTQIANPNYVLVPAIPTDYKVVFVSL